MTLLVLGLDALDAELVDYFGYDEFHLGTSTDLESIAVMHDTPFTLEAWPSVATGLPPEQHGVTGAGTSEWDNPLVDLASRFTGHMTENMRSRLGDLAEDLLGASWAFGTTDEPTMFDGKYRVVHNFPGVANSREIQRVWDLMNLANDGDISREEFDREILGIAAAQFGWAREMLNHDLEVAGVHVHAPDAFGHPYCRNEERLEAMYGRVAAFVSELRAELGEGDELLVLSDHGMQVEWLGDETPGSHSWRAFASTTLDTVPDHVYDVKAWVDEHASEVEGVETEIEMPEEQLRDLGYLD